MRALAALEILKLPIQQPILHGLGDVFFAEPFSRAVLVMDARGGTLLRRDAEITGEPFLPEFRCKVGEFFAV